MDIYFNWLMNHPVKVDPEINQCIDDNFSDLI